MRKSFVPARLLFCSFLILALSAPALADESLLCTASLNAARPDIAESYVVPFQLAIQTTSTGLHATLINGSDRMDFSSVVEHGRQITLRLDQYDATLIAHWTSATRDALEGEYVRQKGSSLTRYSLNAHCTSVGAQAQPLLSLPAPERSFAGDWQFAFTGPDGKPDAETNSPARFTQNANHVEGTIAPVSGDYGLLTGEISIGTAPEIHLARFDGIHALRLDGHYITPDRVEGVFHVAPGHPLNVLATRSSASAGFEEAERLTSVENPAEPFRFHGLDQSGATVTQDDPRFGGKVVLVDIFGTWCPNCHDEAPVLRSLYSQFHGRGLEIVGLSYEYVDDRVRSQRLLEVYRRKYSITFPLLLAGTTDEGQIAQTLPQLRNFGAYPTTIFLDRHGRVRLIHAGFTGPATGRLEEVKQSFERTILKLLDEK